MLKNRSIICFAGEDWWYHHPHSKNHLMRQFARAGNKVIFVNSISMGLPKLGHKDLLPKIARKLKSYAKLVRTTDEGITVVSPAAIPFYGSPLARKINQILLQQQIKFLARKKGMTAPILWIAIPTAAELIGKMDESCVIYQVSDKYDANNEDHNINPETIRRLHNHAIQHADIILYSGRKLLAEAEHGLEKSHLLEQAVDFDHWSQVTVRTGSDSDWVSSTDEVLSDNVSSPQVSNGLSDNLKSKIENRKSLEVPHSIASIPRPRLGYFGAIDPWLMDQELIKRASKERPEWHWIFIGNLARGTDLANLPNVHFFPPVNYNDLPNYAAGFDVCVLPWETKHAFTSYGSAIKVREYLATGLPVVISPLPEYEHMSEVLRIARTRDEFIHLIQDALNESDPQLATNRQNAVRPGTWHARAEWVSTLIESAGP